MPARRSSLTCTTGATSSGGGHDRAASQPGAAVSETSKRCTRLLFVSATYTRPAQSTAIACGCENAPGPTPRTPHFAMKRPSASNASTRLLPPSSTSTRPAASVAIPDGASSCPLPPPSEPHADSNAPAGESLTTRLFSRSATYTAWSGDTATAAGPLNSPGPLPAAPSPPPAPMRSRRTPSGPNASTRLCGVSARNVQPVDGSTATACTPASTGPPDGPPPSSERNVPSPHRCATRALPVSATYTDPRGSTATPEGASHPIPPAPAAFHTPASASPPAENSSTRLPTVSDT